MSEMAGVERVVETDGRTSWEKQMQGAVDEGVPLPAGVMTVRDQVGEVVAEIVVMRGTRLIADVDGVRVEAL